MRRNPKRDQTEKTIVEALRGVGASVTRLDDPGIPDLLVGFRGKTFLLEVKTGLGKLNELQQQFFESWRGGQLSVVRDPIQALKAVGALGCKTS